MLGNDLRTFLVVSFSCLWMIESCLLLSCLLEMLSISLSGLLLYLENLVKVSVEAIFGAIVKSESKKP